MRRGREPHAQIECRVKGEIEPLMDSKVLVDMDSIFDDGTFENARRPMVILVEGALGSGKTSLAYHYCQKWAEGNLSMFDVVALVYLRHPAVHSAELELTLHQLLLLACASDDCQRIDGITREIVQCVENGLKLLIILQMGGMKHRLVCEIFQIRNVLLIIRFSANSFVLFHPTQPSSSPLDQTPHWTYTTEPMLTEWRFLGSPRRAFMTTSRKHCLLSYPLIK